MIAYEYQLIDNIDMMMNDGCMCMGMTDIGFCVRV